MKNNVLEVLKALDDDALVSVWNEYCYATNRYDDEILDQYALSEWLNNCDDKMDVLNRFYFGHDEMDENSSANPNRTYFCFNGYGNIISFDYIYNNYTEEFYIIDVDSLVDYIVENEEDFGVNEIADALSREEV